MNTVWKDIPGYEGCYQVSNLGQIKGLARIIESPGAKRGYPKPVKEKELAPQFHSAGYLSVQLQGTGHLVHSLVALAFLGKPLPGLCVCHNDGNRHNNNIENLRYDTPRNNTADMRTHGTTLFGETSPASRLTEEEVREILAAKDRGESSKELALVYGVSWRHIDRLKRRESWKHLHV